MFGTCRAALSNGEKNVPPDPTVPNSNGAGSTESEPRRSLRETLEAAWDKVVEDAPDDDGGAPDQAPPVAEPVDTGSQPRDVSGRWVKRDAQPGEAEPRSQQAEHPAPPETSQQAREPHPAPETGVAAQAPANWDAEGKAAFDEQTDKGKQFLLRRHSEMESFVQQRLQANAQAADFAQSLAPVFNDPRVSRSLQQAGVGPAEAVNQWAGFHLRFEQDPVGMIGDLIQRARIDPAVFARMSPAGQPAAPPPELKDPGLKFLADHIGRIANDQVAMRNELEAQRNAAVERQQQEVKRVALELTNAVGDETDANGNKLRPYFDDERVMAHMRDLVMANPRRDLREAYDMAVWAVPDLREERLAAERRTVEQRYADQRAAQAVRSNIRGRTSTVTPPPPPEGQKRSLRDILEKAADEVGLE